MIDPEDIIGWALAGFCVVTAILFIGLLGMMGGAAYFSVQCYRSGNPDSIACYMATGNTSRIKADVTTSSQ